MKTGKSLIEDINSCTLAPGQCALWWLGQHGFVVKLGETVLYLDAYLSPNRLRQVEPLLKPEQVTNASAILGTHDHSDHIDREAWPGLAAASPKAMFVMPKLLREKVAQELTLPEPRVIGLDQGLSASVGGVEITGVPAAHELLDTDEETGLHPYLGYILRGNGFTLYHSGDTCIYEGMQAILRQWKLDAMLLPINGRDARRLKSHCIGNMTYQEAVDLAGALEPGLVIPTHFDMFKGNTENPQLFVDYLQVKYPRVRTQVPEHGERMLLSAGRSSASL